MGKVPLNGIPVNHEEGDRSHNSSDTGPESGTLYTDWPNFSGPQFPFLKSGGNHFQRTGLICELGELIKVKCLD